MWITISDLIDCPSLPSTERGCRKAMDKLTKENPNIRRKREGTKAFEYNSLLLSAEVQAEIHAKFAVSVINSQPKKLPVARESLDVQGLSDKQRAIADARMALVAYVTQLEQVKARYLAVQQVVDMAKAGTLPEHLKAIVSIANAKQGKNRTLSQRSLMQWVVDYHKCSNMTERLQRLAPIGLGKPKTDVMSLAWLHDFLPIYQDPNRPTVVACIHRLRNFSAHPIPSETRIREVLKSLPVLLRERGRTTGAVYRQLNIYTERDWEVLNVNECWIGDGHGFKAKVRHPLTGKPFQPEVTAIIDGRTRVIVGWSVAMSENVIAVCDALRHGISCCGMPNFYYSDNGGGESNKTLDAELTGILPRLGIHHETGRPGNPQGRGIIERFWRTAIIPLAREYQTYQGASIDRETYRIRYKNLESAVNLSSQGKALRPVQQKALNAVPTFQQFLDDLERVIKAYNRTPHSSLPKINGEHYTPADYQAYLLANTTHNVERLSELELSLLFRPEVVRKVARGMIEFSNNSYFHLALADYHDQEVRVCYDIHHAESVIIKSMDGGWICNAIWNGNRVDAFPKSVRQKAEEARVKGQVNRLDKQIQHKKSFLNPVITIEHNEGAELLHGLREKAVKPKANEWSAMLPSELEHERKKAIGE